MRLLERVCGDVKKLYRCKKTCTRRGVCGFVCGSAGEFLAGPIEADVAAFGQAAVTSVLTVVVGLVAGRSCLGFAGDYDGADVPAFTRVADVAVHGKSFPLVRVRRHGGLGAIFGDFRQRLVGRGRQGREDEQCGHDCGFHEH